jgi:CHAD domain-containing protein
MPRYEKWLHTVAATAPSDEVARTALAERLLAVSFYLKQAIGGDDEPEAIHQLRVWTRRAAAALDLFELGLPRQQRERMLKTLHKLRHVAGKVRDCDLQRQRLKGNKNSLPKTALRALKQSRRHARKRLKKLRRHLRHGNRLRLQIAKLLAKIAWPQRRSRDSTPPFAALCRHHVKIVSSEFLKQANSNLHDFDNLHQLRIAGKQLRYALELVASSVPARPLLQLYRALNAIQDRLGLVCDERAILDSLQTWLDDTTSKKLCQRLEILLQAQDRRYQSAYKKLLRWWSAKLLRRLRQLCKAVSK